jgi:uncharacterized protein
VGREIIQRDDVRRVLEEARTIAVLGAHPDHGRAASYVPDYLRAVGYRVLPVNPRFVGQTLFESPVRATLAELAEPVDVVDVFRRAVDLPAHIDDILAMRPRPRVVWLQSGIENDEFAARLIAEGIDVVQDRCTYADHRAFGIAPRRSP